ncbi:uncharacterized protein LOC135243762 [Anguilla rostrata]|uniref:uncharacterized protein LOC135243762 n=1 Tax=Anguilla rostrata TaxID=7938 RepID=UPI0030CEEE31
MKTELEALGLWPASRPVRHLMNMVSLWRHPPQPELIETSSKLPSPKHFQLHPFFIWKPEHAIMERVRNNYILPCLYGCASPQVLSAGVGRPCVIVGTSGQYYIFASRLTCKVCRRYWFADKPQWLETLPRRFTNILPAFLTHKKAICKTVMDELRRTGKSPNDMANQVTELLHLKYERANLAYLLAVQNIRDAEAGLYGQATITGYLQQADSPAPFGQYEDQDGWYGVSVSSHYLTDYLLQEFQRQEAAFTQLLQGTFGQVFRSDHTRRMARKVTISSGTMSSYAIMNENWMILSWVMLQSECDKSLKPMYEGLANRYSAAGVEKAKYQWVDRDCCAPFRVPDLQPFGHLQWVSWQTTDAIVVQATSGSLISTCASRSKFNQDIAIRLDLFHCMRRFTRECVSEHHPLYSTFCKFLSAAFTIVDQGDLQKLKVAYRFCGIVPAEPTKQHIREHCRMKVPYPRELVQRVEDVLRHFHLAKDPNDTLLYKPSMLKMWRIQRVHILRGCLSDAEVEDGVLYRYGGTVQLNHVKRAGATVPVWIPIRGTSQQEGFHFHQALWVTGNQVSNELFQAQGLAGVARWNFQSLVDLKLPEVVLPAMFDPVLVCELNQASEKVMGQFKYPALHITGRDTGERFGLQYLEPGCRPVPLDWQKHKTQKTVLPPPVETQLPSTQALSAPPVVLHFPPTVEDKRDTDTAQSFESGEPSIELDPSLTARTLPSPQSSQQTAFCHPKLSTKQEEESNILSLMDTGLQSTSPLPQAASPRAARTGPVKTGGLVFVLDHNRWPSPMTAVIDGLLAKHKGEKDFLQQDFLQQVERDYAALVQSTCSGPNSLLHPTTRQHISRYVKYLAKKTNASTSLNTSPEKLQETQQLWQHLTAGSQTVPVVTLPSALINPVTSHGSDTQGAPVTKATVEKLVQEILQKQQAAMQPQKKKTRNCLACGQPKSRYLGDGSSIHHFYQSGEVKFFYCSTRMYQTYPRDRRGY